MGAMSGPLEAVLSIGAVNEPEIPDAVHDDGGDAGPPASTAHPHLEVVGDVYRFEWRFLEIEAELERIAEHRDELSAEITIRSNRPPRARLLHSARLNLMSTQSRAGLARALAQREADLDWHAMLEELCFLARERYRTGEPSIDMRFFERSDVARWLVEPFVERGGPTILFSDGGTGKSLAALAIAITAASGSPVLGRLQGPPVAGMFLDWETDPNTFDERLAAVLAGANIGVRPPVFYRRMTASLAESASLLRREIVKQGVEFVVVDSMGPARGGEPESADSTIRLFNGARSLGVPWLGVDHVTKQNGNGGSRPFGSAYTHNLARLTWGADKAQEEGADTIILALRNHKRNNGRLLPQLGYRLEFSNGPADELLAVRFARADLAKVPGLSERLPLKDRILAELGTAGPLSPTDLAGALDEKVNAIGARLTELKTKSRVLRLADGTYALQARTDEVPG
jgi:hypothetical protein